MVVALGIGALELGALLGTSMKTKSLGFWRSGSAGRSGTVDRASRQSQRTRTACEPQLRSRKLLCGASCFVKKKVGAPILNTRPTTSSTNAQNSVTLALARSNYTAPTANFVGIDKRHLFS